jgi:hypothetical protein
LPRRAIILSTSPRYRLLVGVEVLVDWRADDHDHVLRTADDRRVGRGGQSPARRRLLQQRAGALLGEWHPALADQLDSGRVDVVYRDPGAAVGKRDSQRQPDVAAAADDHDVTLEGGATL